MEKELAQLILQGQRIAEADDRHAGSEWRLPDTLRIEHDLAHAALKVAYYAFRYPMDRRAELSELYSDLEFRMHDYETIVNKVCTWLYNNLLDGIYDRRLLEYGFDIVHIEPEIVDDRKLIYSFSDRFYGDLDSARQQSFVYSL
jgi:hypothetical protein